MKAISTSMLLVVFIASAVLMVAGHILITGKPFDPNGQNYNLFTHWVSDYAAYPGYGWFIKSGIILFCFGIFHFLNLALSFAEYSKYRVCHKLWWKVLGTMMIGGLLLVVVFDMSPPHYTYKGPNVFMHLLGYYGDWIEDPKSPVEWVMRGHHQIGFQLFIIGFYLAAISMIFLEYFHKLSSDLSTAIHVFILTSILTLWLFLFHNILAGIPQRVLLLLIYFWVIRSIRICRKGYLEKANAKQGAAAHR